MTMKLLALITILLTAFVMPAVADDVNIWIQDLKDPIPAVREAAAEALVRLNDTRAVGPLILALDDDDFRVRQNAAVSLGKLNDLRAVDPLIQALKDEDLGVRVYAAVSLGNLNDTRAVDPLIQALKDEDSRVRQRAASSLGELNDTSAVGPLILAFRDEDSGVQVNAAWSLGELNDTRAVGPLIQALKDEDLRVRQNAAGSLGNLNDTRAVDPLIQALKDEDSGVRLNAAVSLGKLNDLRAVDPLIQALKDEDLGVRVNAARSLDQLRLRIESTPQSWNLQSACPGISARANFSVKNVGETLQNLSYIGVIENTTLREFEGRVGYKETWNKTVNVTEGTKKISAELSRVGGSNESEVALVFENPEGVGKEENADVGSGNLGPIEINNPELGNWTLKVYGYNVPETGESFKVSLKEYAEEQWSWIATKGPERIESDSNGTVDANITIPKGTSLPRLDGYIKIASDSRTFEIPVSVTMAGTGLEDKGLCGPSE